MISKVSEVEMKTSGRKLLLSAVIVFAGKKAATRQAALQVGRMMEHPKDLVSRALGG